MGNYTYVNKNCELEYEFKVSEKLKIYIYIYVYILNAYLGWLYNRTYKGRNSSKYKIFGRIVG